MKRIKKSVHLVTMLIILVTAIGATEYRRQQRVCTQISVAIEHDGIESFVSEREIRGLLQQGEKSIIGLPLNGLELKQLEHRVLGNPYVEWANVHYDLEGKVHVAVQQSRPIARIIHPKLPDAYVSTTGKLLPLSGRHTARVMLVGGTFIPKLIKGDWNQDSTGNQLLSLAKYIEQDDFWRAQIAQMDVNQQGEVTLHPQVGKQTIKFGKPDQIAEKFDKLELFYQQILPRKGWNYYNGVNLTYENQIVCD
ncbi:cell division protein FtsQ/DivIB [Tunicatimonas pelagia]|uniref:cell division protein FtsQ/DivIB n=1 Tax=Tunicatimonas pelagia TaxID=931531 RepID=UPI002664E7DC|nr:cell division protein FtsQ [Tunicatimonas pelagia]WKN41367.1 cell division protein FtsQ [Tunicatimonas pelagia]